MKSRHVAGIVAVAFLFVVSVGLTAQQDRFTLKAANGIAISEFKGYEAWPVVAVSHPDNAGGCGTSKEGCIKVILGNPTTVKAFSDGIPANGKPFPDGVAFAKVEWLPRHEIAPYGVTVPGAQTEVGFMVKDSKRFADTNGWGYITLKYEASSDSYRLATNDPAAGRKLCHGCHTAGAKASDYVFTHYGKR